MSDYSLEYIKELCDKHNFKLIKVGKGKIKVFHKELKKYFRFSLTDFILNKGLMINENTEEWNKKIKEKCDKVGCRLLLTEGLEHVVVIHDATNVKYKVQTKNIMAENFKPYV